MKRCIFLCLFFLCFISASSVQLKFFGVPIFHITPNKLNQTIIGKGYKLTYTNRDGQRVTKFYDGKFDGQDAEIMYSYDSKNNFVISLFLDVYTKDPKYAADLYYEMVEKYKKDYPDLEIESEENLDGDLSNYDSLLVSFFDDKEGTEYFSIRLGIEDNKYFVEVQFGDISKSEIRKKQMKRSVDML